MEFEYNGNLLEDERIDLVANEIISKYPQVNLKKAKEAAMLEGRISADKTFDDEFNRLYNIMLVNCDNRKIVSIVYKDFLELIKNNNIENNYMDLITSINAYIQCKGKFPLLSDYQ